MKPQSKYSPEVIERAVRMVYESPLHEKIICKQMSCATYKKQGL